MQIYEFRIYGKAQELWTKRAFSLKNLENFLDTTFSGKICFDQLLLVHFACLLVSADKVMNENTNFELGQVHSRAHTRSISEPKEVERLYVLLQLFEVKYFSNHRKNFFSYYWWTENIYAYIKSRRIKLMRIKENFWVMVNGNYVQVNRPAFLDFISWYVKKKSASQIKQHWSLFALYPTFNAKLTCPVFIIIWLWPAWGTQKDYIKIRGNV